jgi:murein DD-endopeptidase MepM/ murein hydrolase activator NlpD
MNRTRAVLAFLILIPIVGGYLAYRWWNGRGGGRAVQVFAWFRDNSLFPDKNMQAGQRCDDAPFIFPIDGLAGFLWGDSFRPGHTHQGVDIFPGTEPGETPVYTAYPGFLTRLPDWRSTVIVRVPSDPLEPGRQIWVYYTHLADQEGNSFVADAFPPGTSEVFVEAGTLLGYAGDYSGNPGNPTGVHLHISIVMDDGQGSFMNELEIRNTYDPSPYFGMALNAEENPDEIPTCAPLEEDA